MSSLRGNWVVAGLFACCMTCCTTNPPTDPIVVIHNKWLASRSAELDGKQQFAVTMSATEAAFASLSQGERTRVIDQLAEHVWTPNIGVHPATEQDRFWANLLLAVTNKSIVEGNASATARLLAVQCPELTGIPDVEYQMAAEFGAKPPAEGLVILCDAQSNAKAVDVKKCLMNAVHRAVWPWLSATASVEECRQWIVQNGNGLRVNHDYEEEIARDGGGGVVPPVQLLVP